MKHTVPKASAPVDLEHNASDMDHLLRRMIHRLKQGYILGLEHAGSKVTRLEYTIINILSGPKDEKLTMSELADLMGVEPPTLVSSIDKLETKKLITKNRDPKDRRRMPLALTESGRELSHKILEPTAAAFHKSFQKLGPEKTKQFMILLNEVIENTSIMEDVVTQPVTLDGDAEATSQ